MSKFKVGEVVIIQSKDRSQHNGKEVEIIKIYPNDALGCGYGVLPDYSSDYSIGFVESALRKKKPPKEELGSWEELEHIWSRPKVGA